MPIFCEKCNGANPVDGVKCWHCGATLVEEDWTEKQSLEVSDNTQFHSSNDNESYTWNGEKWAKIYNYYSVGSMVAKQDCIRDRQGAIGVQGPTGAQGRTGTQGSTGHILECMPIGDDLNEQLIKALAQQEVYRAKQARDAFTVPDMTNYFEEYYNGRAQETAEINKILSEAEKKIKEYEDGIKEPFSEIPIKDWADMNTNAIRNKVYMMNLGNQYRTCSMVIK